MTLFTVSLVTGLLWGLATSVLTVRAPCVINRLYSGWRVHLCVRLCPFARCISSRGSIDDRSVPLMLPLGYYVGSAVISSLPICSCALHQIAADAEFGKQFGSSISLSAVQLRTR